MKVKDKILREVVQEIISEKKKKGDCILARDYAISKVLMTEVFAELSKRGIIKMGVGNTYVLTEYCVELSRQYCYDMIVSDIADIAEWTKISRLSSDIVIQIMENELRSGNTSG